MLTMLLVLCLAAGTLRAEEAQWYEVELIVFANAQEDDGQEFWPPLEEGPDPGAAVTLGEDPALEPVPEGGTELAPVLEALERSSLYRPLLHWRWRQPGWDGAAAKRIRVSVPMDAPLPLETPPLPGLLPAAPETDTLTEIPLPEPATEVVATETPEEGLESLLPEPDLLSGTLRLRRGRYLHLDVDLVYREPVWALPEDGSSTGEGGETGTDVLIGGGDGDGDAATGDETEATTALLPPVPELREVRMTQSRRMRSGELHYIDHPRFGILVLVTPYEPPPAATPPTSLETPPADEPTDVSLPTPSPAPAVPR